MGTLMIVNAPRSFSAIWQAIKPWLAKETVAKIHILDDRYAKTLLEHVDAESLPTFLGGKCTCEGLGGCSLSSAGPWLEGRDWKNRSWEQNYPDRRRRDEKVGATTEKPEEPRQDGKEGAAADGERPSTDADAASRSIEPV